MHGEGVGGRRRVRILAGVTTRGTRALGVGLGDRPLQVGPRCGYIRGTHAEWTSRTQLGKAARPSHSIQLRGRADAGGGSPTFLTSS